MQQVDARPVGDPGVDGQRPAGLGILGVFVEQAALRDAFGVALEQHREDPEPQVFFVFSGGGEVVGSLPFEAVTALGRDAVPALQVVDVLRELAELGVRYRLRRRGQQVSETVQTTATEHVHPAQVASRHILGHLAERPPLAGAIVAALHANDRHLSGRLEPGVVGVR